MKICVNRICAIAAVLFAASCAPGTEVAELKCEMSVNPPGVDTTAPRLSWMLKGKNNERQRGFRIIAASSPERLKAGDADLWDSGEIISGRHEVVYAGLEPVSRQECFWKVCVFGEGGKTYWSETAGWTMGLLNEEDWLGEWIGCDTFNICDPEGDPYRFSREFRSEHPIRKAMLYIAATSRYELYLGGRRVGGRMIPALSAGEGKPGAYDTFDVTDRIVPGDNTMEVVLGNSRPGLPEMILQLEINYEDGTRQTLGSYENWAVSPAGR